MYQSQGTGYKGQGRGLDLGSRVRIGTQGNRTCGKHKADKCSP